jgi:hypothetical protein
MRLFYRLLDARVISAIIRAALDFAGHRRPGQESQVTFRLQGDRNGAAEAAERLGGRDGASLLASAQASERRILDLLDSLLPVRLTAADTGHAEFYSLRLLSDAEIWVGDSKLETRPLVMFDDGHRLGRIQRDALLRSLTDRSLNLARWYSERYEALSDQEIVADLGTGGRDYELVILELAARRDESRGAFHHGRFERMLGDIANRRAGLSLARYAGENQEFMELISVDDDEFLAGKEQVATEVMKRVSELAGGEPRYAAWLDAAVRKRGYAAAVQWRILEALIVRDRNRSQIELFDIALTPGELDARSEPLREAAAVALANEFKLPYYAGSDRLSRLGSWNVDQFLAICGDIFEEMLAEISLQRHPRIPAARQDRLMKVASEVYWKAIRQRVPNGAEVQILVRAIVAMARQENRKPTFPYAPGVTGTALTMSDRSILLNAEQRVQVPGATELFQALASGISRNVFSAELDRPVKGGRYMVIYLNRLLCPRFGLPLGRGGFREKPLRIMTEWMLTPRLFEDESEPEYVLEALPL